MPNPGLLPYIEVFFAVVVWGASFIATKVVKDDMALPHHCSSLLIYSDADSAPKD